MSASALNAHTAVNPMQTDSVKLHYSPGSVLAVVRRADQIPALIDSLVRAGIDREQVDVLSRGNVEVRPARFNDWFARWLAYIGPERDLTERYSQAILDGAAVIVVERLSHERQQFAALAIATAGGRFIHSFGYFTVRSIAP